MYLVQSKYSWKKGQSIVKKQELQQLFETHDEWLLRGLLCIYDRQTADEHFSKSVNHNNGKGFKTSDASFLSSIAVAVLHGWPLSEAQLRVTRHKMHKYAQQCLTASKVAENLERNKSAVRRTLKACSRKAAAKAAAAADCALPETLDVIYA
jgi:hypothetical protein